MILAVFFNSVLYIGVSFSINVEDNKILVTNNNTVVDIKTYDSAATAQSKLDGVKTALQQGPSYIDLDALLAA